MGLFERSLHADLRHRQFTGGFEKQHAREVVQMPPKVMGWRTDGADGGEMALRQGVLNNDDGLHAAHSAAFAPAGKVFHHRLDAYDTLQA